MKGFAHIFFNFFREKNKTKHFYQLEKKNEIKVEKDDFICICFG